MLTILAQQASNEAAVHPLDNLFETMTGLFASADALAQPQVVVDHLKTLSVVWAVVFIIVGVLCLLNGAKFYRVATVGIALVMGLFSGYWLGEKIGNPLIVAGCCGVLLAVIVFPLIKYAVAVFGGLTGAFIGANLWAGFAHAINKGAETQIPADAYWIGALVGLLICGMLAFILFKLSIELFTSVSGSTVAMLGALALLLSFEPWQESVTQGLTANQLIIPLLVFVPAIIGLILQETFAASNPAAGGQEPAKA
jgi:hypothetical protein